MPFADPNPRLKKVTENSQPSFLLRRRDGKLRAHLLHMLERIGDNLLHLRYSRDEHLYCDVKLVAVFVANPETPVSLLRTETPSHKSKLRGKVPCISLTDVIHYRVKYVGRNVW